MPGMKRCDRTEAVLNLSPFQRDGQKGRAPAAPGRPGRADAPPAFPFRAFPFCFLLSFLFLSIYLFLLSFLFLSISLFLM
ncbi:hypothetical protein [Raoultella terrigena]|jgi:hypothetical protein|uniref:hypothetical protein n=1 Tax=Raoultella terrigena TaxID=577 RepID=UPI00349F9887